ncbi:MAG: DUF167 family protein [Thiohalomonadales bacterium]|nr:DUF167 family protein [Thiohalomonadales bacterium]
MKARFYSWHNDSLLLHIYVQPRASQDEIVGPHGDSLKVRITAPPVEGKANEHLLKFLAKVFGVSRKQISLTSGQQGRHKLLCITQPSRLPAIIPPPG